MTPSAVAATKLVILYGVGGLSDVGRHAILAALEQVEKYPKLQITVLTEYPELLQEAKWECNCTGGHTDPSVKGNHVHSDKVNVVKIIDSWKTPQKNLAQHFENANAVISCLGHRQPGYKRGLIAAAGNKQVIQAMQEAKVERAVVMSSIGIQEDWPPMEFHWSGKIMGWLFQTRLFCKSSFEDLNAMEIAYKEATELDYLFIRPCGLGEEVVPENKWFLQQEKFNDAVGGNMAKMDCARYMVQEALNPIKHKTAVVIGSEPPKEEEEAGCLPVV